MKEPESEIEQFSEHISVVVRSRFSVVSLERILILDFKKNLFAPKHKLVFAINCFNDLNSIILCLF